MDHHILARSDGETEIGGRALTKDIRVSVAGTQFEVEPNEPVELITFGNYYNKNGKHYILYDEIDPEEGENIKNRIKIGNGKIEVVKTGTLNGQLIFEQGKNHLTYYDTGMGSFLMGVNTDSIRMIEEEDHIRATVRYSLEMNYTHVSDCEITIDVQSK